MVLDQEVERRLVVELDLQQARDDQFALRLGAEGGDGEHVVVQVTAPGDRRLRGEVQGR